MTKAGSTTAGVRPRGTPATPTTPSPANLTNIAYPASGTVKFTYDVLNRVTNMVDSLGTTRYTYDAAGQLLTASGPFSSDTLTNTYSNRRRVALALQEPSGHVWTNGFGWDLAGRLTSVTSPAGGFAYAYMALDSTFSGRLVQELAFPSGAYITNFYDPVARLVGTVLESSGSSALDAALYGYNEGNQRTAYTNAAGAYDLYTYDPIGQLKVGTSSTVSEDRGYGYDAAWNLNYLTNNGMAIEFDVDNRNELTSVVGQSTLTYDANGNLLTGTGTRVGAGTNWNYIYDDENRLVQWFYYQNGIANPATGDLRTDFRYDGLGRLRQRLEYLYNAPTNLLLFAGWNPQSTNEYLYDGWRVLQERDGSNVPLVSYTRGNDLRKGLGASAACLLVRAATPRATGPAMRIIMRMGTGTSPVSSTRANRWWPGTATTRSATRCPRAGRWPLPTCIASPARKSTPTA